MPPRQPKVPISPGDNTFFQTFYEENRNLLFYVANQYADTAADCEDIVQDAVLRLMCNIPSIRTLNRYQAAKYVALTVRSAFLDLQKRRRSAREVSMEEAVLDALLERDSQLADSRADLRMELIHLKQSLTAREWMLLEGKYILGYDQTELSELMGIAPDSIRMTLSRVRAKARSILLADTGKEGEPNA